MKCTVYYNLSLTSLGLNMVSCLNVDVNLKRN